MWVVLYGKAEAVESWTQQANIPDCAVLPLPVASGQGAGFLIWIFHPPLTDGSWIIWSHFLYMLCIPNWS